ncbi:MAG: hypothetical protein COT89_01765 [Candidatus Colwellbacteria bacterium CG10_big_fil_rev_8_21_14_0_10_42_22]|uniref:Uncharacterized protein n=1 Tax=Candidatus Colwellbacteria bacterium CG10_big_fil_rev_8_21_14_0_10_42_22 TaxID=1974540 RepID=A0A2H0VI25_9BACT|nr:MAG: hypothetical protein COT89_01765 [Candidatus Colwellbacteria bacterium CG10_big_fil_rev_8_21_14_0_10_42_22]
MKDKKIGLPELVLLTIPIAGLELLEAITMDGSSLIFPAELSIVAVTQIYLNMKGVHVSAQKKQAVGNVLELIPGIGILPIRTISWFMAVRGANKEAEKEDQEEQEKKSKVVQMNDRAKNALDGLRRAA